MLDVGMCAYHMLIFLAQAFVIKLDTSHPQEISCNIHFLVLLVLVSFHHLSLAQENLAHLTQLQRSRAKIQFIFTPSAHIKSFCHACSDVLQLKQTLIILLSECNKECFIFTCYNAYATLLNVLELWQLIQKTAAFHMPHDNSPTRGKLSTITKKPASPSQSQIIMYCMKWSVYQSFNRDNLTSTCIHITSYT